MRPRTLSIVTCSLRKGFHGALALVAVGFLAPATAAESAADLAKKSQNPVSDLISLPFQNNTNFSVGPRDGTQNVLNIQPVVPFKLNENWNLITRTILPVIVQDAWSPALDGDPGVGLGDLNTTLFFSPRGSTGGLTWGLGPVLLFPTATDDVFGSGKWGAGPAGVVVYSTGSWLFGALANNIWSYAGDSDRTDVNALTVQPFINYNLPDGWFLVTAPIVTANWEANDDNRWTVPIGGGFGRVFSIGPQPVSMSAQGYYNVVTPDDTGGDFTLRLALQFLFPK